MSQFFWMLAAALLATILSPLATKLVYSRLPQLRIQVRNKYRMLRWGRRPLASIAGWLGDTRWLSENREGQVIQERLETASELDELNAPYGVPYRKLDLAHQLGITVSQFNSLPHNEQLAWGLFFSLPEASRESLYNRRTGAALDELEDEGLLEPSRVLRCSWSGCRRAQVDSGMCESHAREWRKQYGVRRQA